MTEPRLDRRVKIGTLSQSETADQDFVISFTEVLELWMSVKPHSGRRQLEAGEQVITDYTEFIMRWRNDFVPTKNMRFLYLSRYYTIHSVIDMDDRRRWYQVLTRVTDENSTLN